MPQEIKRLSCIMLLLVLAGCDTAAEKDLPIAAADAQGESASAAEQGHADHGTEHAHSNQQAMPLLPIMMRMAAEMTGFVNALWLEDYEAMTRHARGISAHADISTDELERIASILDTEMEDFEAADEEVHLASVRMLEASEEEDMDSILQHLATVQSGCVACHTRFRERLRTNR